MTANQATAVEVLAPIIESAYTRHAADLERHKAGREQLYAEDFLWKRLLVSMATMGNSRGWDGLIDDANNYRLVTYEELAGLGPAERLDRLRDVLGRAKVRMPAKKAQWLAGDFDRIQALGGLQTANERFRAMNDRDEIIAFLTSFSGIGPKYARNIPMDVYHPAFRETVAIDERITTISETLGLAFAGFLEHEAFYLHVAKRVGLEGWELDRLLYNFNDEILLELRSAGRQQGAVSTAPRRSIASHRSTAEPKATQKLNRTPPRARADHPTEGDHRDLFQAVQRAFRTEFPKVTSYMRSNGRFYGRGTHVFFVAIPKGRSVVVHLHAAKDELPKTDLVLTETLHSQRADPPVQRTTIDSEQDIPEIMRLAHFAHRFWGSA